MNLHPSIDVEKRDELDASATAVAREEGLVLVREEPLLLEAAPDTLVPPVTLAPFVRSHFAVPEMPANHRIRLTGAVDHPLAIGLPELRAMEQREVIMTLECAGNSRLRMTPPPDGEPWGEGAVSTLVWNGVPMRDLLERAGLRPEVIEIRAEGADTGQPDGAPGPVSFARTLPLDKALHPDTLLALEMNGAPLAIEHGAPVRLVVPGWYGMASVKWLARLEARTKKFEGWFQSDRYVYQYADDLPAVDVDEIQVKSMVIVPEDGAAIRRGLVRVRGWAWSAAEIERVEISIDHGPWQRATLGSALGPHAWRPFELAWDADQPGRHTLRTRATDARGNVQPDWARFNKLGYGNNAVRTTVVNVR